MLNDRSLSETSMGNSGIKKSNNEAIAFDGRNLSISKEVHHTLRVGRDSGDAVVVASTEVSGTLTACRGNGFRSDGTPTQGIVIEDKRRLRHLIPREWERLQGIPDDYTAITYRKKPACDAPRYRALGNSIAVPILNWIGRRIAKAFAVDAPARPELAPERTPPMQEARDLILRDEPGKT